MIVKFNIPTVSDYAKGFPQYWMKYLFIGAVCENYQVNSLITTYVRLVEAALVEYRFGQQELKQYWTTHSSIDLGALNKSISHFENCLSTMHRAIKCFTRLRGHKHLPDDLRMLLKEERARFPASYVSDQLRNIRHQIHHTEEHLMNGRIQRGQPIAVMPDGPELPHPTDASQTIKTIDRLSVGQIEIKFSDLAMWLREMGKFADKISKHDSTKETACASEREVASDDF